MAISDDYLITNCLLIKDKKSIVINDLGAFISSKYPIIGNEGSNVYSRLKVSIHAKSSTTEYIDGFDRKYEIESMK